MFHGAVAGEGAVVFDGVSLCRQGLPAASAADDVDLAVERVGESGTFPGGKDLLHNLHSSFVGKPRMRAEIEKAPFCAVPQWPAIHHTMGGLQITVITGLLDREGKVIPKLYAAGEVTGGVHGGHRLGGCDCVVMKRVGGKSAAAEKAGHRRITLKCRAGPEKALPFMNIPQNIPSCRRG